VTLERRTHDNMLSRLALAENDGRFPREQRMIGLPNRRANVLSSTVVPQSGSRRAMRVIHSVRPAIGR